MKNTVDFIGNGLAGVDANGLINSAGLVSTGAISAPTAAFGTLSGTWNGAITGTTGAFSGAIGVNGSTPPTQAALPTTLAQVITILTNLGFCASS